MSETLIVKELGRSLEARANNEGVLLYSSGSPIGSKAEITQGGGLNQYGKLFAQHVDQIIESGLASPVDNGLLIPYDSFSELEKLELAVFDEWVDSVPFSLTVNSSGSIGTESFRLEYEFLNRQRPVHVKRVGAYIQAQERVYSLSYEVYSLLDTIDSFNSLPPNDRSRERALRDLHKLQLLSNESNSELDSYLRKQSVVIPSKVGVEVIAHEGTEQISLAPSFAGVSQEFLNTEFLKFNEIPDSYDLPTEDGGRTRVILDTKIKDVLEDIKRVRRVAGNEKERVLADINEVFSDGLDHEVIDLDEFGPRVKGIGDPPMCAKIGAVKRSTDWSDAEKIASDEFGFTVSAESYGEHVEIPIESDDDLLDLVQAVDQAKGHGEVTLTYKGQKLLIDEAFEEGLAEAAALVEKKRKKEEKDAKEASYRYLLIYTNEEEDEYKEGSLESSAELHPCEIPAALRNSFSDRYGNEHALALKEHQKQGVQWLQGLFRDKFYRKGGLLADDMGLGKTLQILTFAAWCIESGYKEGLGGEEGPYEPILIVAPKILLDNWLEELERFFDFNIFLPYQKLHGSELKKLVVLKERGREIELGVPKLDLDEIRKHRLVVTNYDTVVNYQHSFGRIRWSVVVCDEAQEIKEHSSKKSKALKALNSVFRIICTGTPVENRLLDLWNLIDFIQPGTLFSSAREFSRNFENRLDELTPEERQARFDELRRKLMYGKPNSFVLRREKDDLPEKYEKRIECPLTAAQREAHIDLVRHMKSDDSRLHHFQLLDQLRKLYMHPRLNDKLAVEENIDALIDDSPKLQAVLSLLEDIEQKQEKVLIFTESINMQTILAAVIQSKFSLQVDVINGSTKAGGISANKRKEAIEEFEQKPGFNVIILSLKVAGVGLTITGANHVIHYSRWWNPAKESQATDRAYRIGQQRDVYVYYPIAVDDQGMFESFDKKLDELLVYKQGIARDFLAPTEDLNAMKEGLYSAFQGHQEDTVREEVRTPLTAVEISELSHVNFEALVAALYQGEGYEVVLTPAASDRGIDAVAVSQKEVILIQAKHSAVGAKVSDSALDELINGYDYYRRSLFPESFKKRDVKLLAVTNSEFERKVKSMAKEAEIELLESKKFVKRVRKAGLTNADVLITDSKRVKSLEELKRRFQSIRKIAAFRC